MNDLTPWLKFFSEYFRLVIYYNMIGMCIKCVIHMINLREIHGPIDLIIAQVKFEGEIGKP